MRLVSVSHFAGVLALMVWACGPPKVNLTPAPTDKTIENIPTWMTTPPNDPGYLFASATATSQDMQVAIDKAKTSAQADIAQQLETRLESLTKRFQEETGEAEDSQLLSQFSAATKVATKQTLVGARAKEQKILPEKGIYRAYVLMSLPLGEANQVLMNQVKANEELYTRFRATQAFEELDKEMQDLEKSQGK
ncbi:MAG: LPP20 family lipoprotein [Candidatus Latescibacteria bacterium]|nr:LPP20 family lipoprotein [Candidatus Latescibacterota bacterium]